MLLRPVHFEKKSSFIRVYVMGFETHLRIDPCSGGAGGKIEEQSSATFYVTALGSRLTLIILVVRIDEENSGLKTNYRPI